MVEQFQKRLAGNKSKRFLFTWAGSFFSFKSFTTDSQEKKSYLTDSQYSTFILKKYCLLWHLPRSGHLLLACKTPGFFYLLIFLVSSPPSTNTLRFPHSSWMNTILGKSSKFPMSSKSIPSSSSLTITIFSEGLCYSTKTWLSLKTKLEK